jgi:hypothetical protein
MLLHAQIGIAKYEKGTSKKLIVKDKTIRVLLDSGLSGDLLFMKKGASKDMSTVVGYYTS